MTDSQRKPSHPPSEPRPSRKSFAEVGAERSGRLQLLGALFLPFVLVAAALYWWRRPRAEELAQPHDAGDPSQEASLVTGAPGPASAPSASPAPKVKLAEVRAVSCQDGKKPAGEVCDRLPAIEQAFAKAIESSGACVPESAGAGTVEYVLDVSFARKKSPITLQLPRAGRSFKNPKVVAGCTHAIRPKVQAIPLEGVTHTHARYKLSIVATYGP